MPRPRTDGFKDGLPYMQSKAKLGAKASHANQHGSYDESNTARKEAEIASRVEYLDSVPPDSGAITDVGNLPPVRKILDFY